MLFVTHTEAVFLVDNHQAEILVLNAFLNQFVRADHDVDLAFGEVVDHQLLVFGGTKTRKRFDTHRPVGEAVAKILEMLFSEQGCRYQHDDLFAGIGGDKRSAHRHFGLAKAHIPTDHAVHRRASAHIGDHGTDRIKLIGRFFELKSVGKRVVIAGITRVGIALASGPLGMNVEQLGGDIAGFFGGFATCFGPLFTTEPVQWRGVFAGTGVTADQVKRRDRHIKLVIGMVGDGQKFSRDAADIERRQALVAPHAMVDMHHRVADLEVCQVGDNCISIACGAATLALTHAAAAQLTFADDGQRRALQMQAAVDGR